MTNGGKLILDDDWRRDKDEPAKQPAATPSVEVDDDWKAQAQREKDELAQKLDEHGDKDEAKGKAPKADFLSIVESFAYQAMMFLGMVEHPQMPGRAVFDKVQSRYLIDCLVVLRDKTQNNLTKEESEILTNTISGLQMSWVEMSEAVARQQAEQAAKGVAGGKPGGIIGA
jgi:hypothetical protein